MDNTIALLIVGLALVAVAVWRVKAQNDNDAKRWDFTDALDELRQVIELVERFAPAADQFVRLGEMEPAQRREAVIKMVLEVLPNVDPKLVGWIIEHWIVVEQPELKNKLQNLTSTAGE